MLKKSLKATVLRLIPAAFLAVALVASAAPAAVAAGSWSTPTPVYAASSIQSPGYAYAPSAIAGTTERSFVCHSRAAGDVRDDVFLVKRTGSTVTSSASVLTASASGWDSFHICDPSVVRVDATLSGQSYDYAMFYLGNDQNCSCHNQIGVAYANSLDGPWVKAPNPVVGFKVGASSSEWGVGQPSATTIDAAAGTVLLTWTEGYSTGTVAKLGQVSLLSGTPTLSGVGAVPTAGLLDSSGAADFLNNFDIAYSPQRDRFYLVREMHPYPSTSPNYISTAVQVLSISGAGMWSGTGTWAAEGLIDASVTGASRSHNPGFLRTQFGTLPDESQLTVFVTTASLDPNSLWSYAIVRTTASL